MLLLLLVALSTGAAGQASREPSGQIKAGVDAELSIWNVKHPAELSYRIGFNPLHERLTSLTNKSST